MFQQLLDCQITLQTSILNCSTTQYISTSLIRANYLYQQIYIMVILILVVVIRVSKANYGIYSSNPNNGLSVNSNYYLASPYLDDGKACVIKQVDLSYCKLTKDVAAKTVTLMDPEEDIAWVSTFKKEEFSVKRYSFQDCQVVDNEQKFQNPIDKSKDCVSEHFIRLQEYPDFIMIGSIVRDPKENIKVVHLLVYNSNAHQLLTPLDDILDDCIVNPMHQPPQLLCSHKPAQYFSIGTIEIDKKFSIDSQNVQDYWKISVSSQFKNIQNISSTEYGTKTRQSIFIKQQTPQLMQSIWVCSDTMIAILNIVNLNVTHSYPFKLCLGISQVFNNPTIIAAFSSEETCFYIIYGKLNCINNKDIRSKLSMKEEIQFLVTYGRKLIVSANIRKIKKIVTKFYIGYICFDSYDSQFDIQPTDECPWLIENNQKINALYPQEVSPTSQRSDPPELPTNLGSNDISSQLPGETTSQTQSSEFLESVLSIPNLPPIETNNSDETSLPKIVSADNQNQDESTYSNETISQNIINNVDQEIKSQFSEVSPSTISQILITESSTSSSQPQSPQLIPQDNAGLFIDLAFDQSEQTQQLTIRPPEGQTLTKNQSDQIINSIHSKYDTKIDFLFNQEPNSALTITMVPELPVREATIEFKIDNHTVTIQTGPIITLDQMTSKRGVKVVKNLQDFGQVVDSESAQIFGYIGIFSLILNSPQEIVQLQFLNYTCPLNVFEFERVLSHWVFDNQIPNWESFPTNQTYELFKTLNITDQVNNPEFDLERYHRIKFADEFLYNIQIQLLCFLGLTLLLIVTCFIKAKRLDQKIMTSLQLEVDELMLINRNSKNVYDQLAKELFSEQRYSPIIFTFLYKLQIEGKLCIITNGIFLQAYYLRNASTFGICSSCLMVTTIFSYTYLHLRLLYQLSSAQKLRMQLKNLEEQQPEKRSISLLEQYDAHLSTKYKYMIEGKNLQVDSCRYYSFYMLIKKWMYAVILIVFYGNVPMQLQLLATNHIIAAALKLIVWPFESKCENILTFSGDICFISALAMKYNDYDNYDIMMQENPMTQVPKWFSQGWMTISFEITFLIFYILVIPLQVILGIQRKRANDERLKKHMQKTTKPAQLCQPSKPFLQQQPIPQSEICQDPQFFYLESDNDHGSDTVNISSDLYGLHEVSRHFSQLNNSYFFEHQSNMIRSAYITVTNRMDLYYVFQRDNSSKIRQGRYKISLYYSWQSTLQSVMIGFSQPYKNTLDFECIQPNFDNPMQYTICLFFDNPQEDVAFRQLQIRIYDTTLSEPITLLLSASDSLLFQPIFMNVVPDILQYELVQSIKIDNVNLNSIEDYLNTNQSLPLESKQVIMLNYPFCNGYPTLLLTVEPVSPGYQIMLLLPEIEQSNDLTKRYFDKLINYLQS